jgi:hypothetical protein
VKETRNKMLILSIAFNRLDGVKINECPPEIKKSNVVFLSKRRNITVIKSNVFNRKDVEILHLKSSCANVFSVVKINFFD